MQWEINEEGHHEKDVDTRQWHTRLKLQLPNLGGIDAQLRLNAQHQLTLFIETQSDSAAKTLNESAEALKKSLGAAGLELLAMNVQNGKS